MEVKLRGGTRPGAGRKPKGTKAFTCRPMLATIERIQTAAHKRGITPGELLDETFGGDLVEFVREHSAPGFSAAQFDSDVAENDE